MNMPTASRSETRVGVALSVALGAIFAVFIVSAAFSPALFAGPLFVGGTVTLWFVFGIGLIWTTVLVIGLYVVWANARDRRR